MTEMRDPNGSQNSVAASRPRLLDLFCGGGGASLGYWLATRNG